MTPLTLHIGMNKTGTTAVQMACFRNQRLLREAGLLYPKSGLGSRSAGRGLHYQLSAAFLSRDPNAFDGMAKLLEEVDAAGVDQVLISSEFFVDLRDLGPLAASLAGRNVRILVYIRRHDHWVSSLFSQGIKSRPNPPWGPSVDQYIRHIRRNIAHYYVFSRLLDRWASAFGAKAMDVRLYGQGDIVHQVLSSLGIDIEKLVGFEMPDDRANRSPSRRQLAAIDHVQRLKGWEDGTRTALIGRILAADDANMDRQLMTHETARALLAEHAQDYADIARRYFARTDGVLFDDPLPKAGGPDQIALWPREGMALMTELLSETL